MKHISTTKRCTVKGKNFKLIEGDKINYAWPVNYNFLLGYCDRDLPVSFNQIKQPLESITVDNRHLLRN